MLTFLVKRSTVKLSGVYIFSRIREKSLISSSNLKVSNCTFENRVGCCDGNPIFSSTQVSARAALQGL